MYRQDELLNLKHHLEQTWEQSDWFFTDSLHIDSPRLEINKALLHFLHLSLKEL